MPTSLGTITDFRDRVSKRLKFWILHIRTLIWRRLKVRPVALRVVGWIAFIYRLRLRRAVFIGVTGSCGKTTTKEMVAAVLSSQYKGHKSPGNNNTLEDVIQALLFPERNINSVCRNSA